MDLQRYLRVGVPFNQTQYSSSDDPSTAVWRRGPTLCVIGYFPLGGSYNTYTSLNTETSYFFRTRGRYNMARSR